MDYDDDDIDPDDFEDEEFYDAHIVRAVFLSDPRGVEKGKQYHYRVAGAKVGDIVTGPGATGPAKVVGIGRKNWGGPVKTGSFWSSVTPTPQFITPPALPTNGVTSMATVSDALKSVFTSDKMNQAFYGHNNLFVPIHAKDKTMAFSNPDEFRNLTSDEQADTLEREAKRIRKAEKKRKRDEREDNRRRELRERRREDALSALHAVVNDEDAFDRVSAAKILLDSV